MSERTIPKFMRVHADKAALDTAQLALYVTICKLLKSELDRILKRDFKS